MSKKVESIIVDSREPETFDELFEEHEDVDEVIRRQMDTGDFIVCVDSDEKPVVFERKTISDFIGSMKNRRLESQVNSMYKTYEPSRSFVLIEGDMQDFDFMPHSEFSAKSAQGFVASLSGRWQCVPLFCSDKVHLADMVVRTARKCVEETERILRDPDDTPTTVDPDYYDKMLIQLDGIGRQTKEEIKKKYSSPEEFVTEASRSGLQEVSGIGKKRAESILEQVRE